VLERRLGLDRWFPHVLLALAIAPLGLLWVDAATREILGVGPFSLELGVLEQRLDAVHMGATGDLAVGVFAVSMSLGLLLRSRVAWLGSVAALTLSLSVRLLAPARGLDMPIALYSASVLVLLIANRRGFSRHSILTSAAFAVVILATFFLWATLGTLRMGRAFAPPVEDFSTALYLAVVTVASVGYGDIVPATPEARLFVVAMITIGIAVGATSISAIIVPLLGGRLRAILQGTEDRMERKDHYVIVGNSPLARNAAVELEKRGQKVTVVLMRQPEADFYKSRDVVVGDATDLSVLRTAGAPASKAVLALTPDDADNGFVVLGVNELDPNITTVAALNDPGNQFRLKRTQPSLLLSLQVLGGELLATALTGERVDEDLLSRALQLTGSGTNGSSGG